MENFKYTCPRCHYNTNDKFNYVKHLKRKVPCSAMYSHTPTQELIDAVNAEKEFRCDKCTRSFSQLYGLNRHKKVHDGETVPVVATPVGPLPVETNNNTNSNTNTTNITEHTNSHNTTIGSHNDSHDVNTNTNITIESLTIQILPFGDEDIAYIQNDSEFLDRCFRQGMERAVPIVTDKIFKDDSHPQNHNVLLGRERFPPNMIYYKKDMTTGVASWVTAPRAQVLQEIVCRGASVLQMHNSHCLSQAADDDVEAKENYDRRNTKLSDMKANKRGTGKIREAVHNKFLEHRDRSINDARVTSTRTASI